VLLSQAIDHYRADRTARGYAKSTIKNEQYLLRDFLVAAGNIQVHSIGPRQIDALYARKQDEWSAGTQNKARAMLSSFFIWCQRRGYLPKGSDPLEGTRNRRVPDRDRTIIPPADLPAVLDVAENPRDRAIIAIGYYLFLRVSETSCLRWQDVDWDHPRKGTDEWKPTVSVFRQKTGTSDVLPMAEELYHELRRWKLAYSAEIGQPVRPGWFVIPSRTLAKRTGVKGRKGLVEVQGSVLLPTRETKDVTRVINRVLKSADLYQLGEGGHTLRRSGAVALYNQLSSVGHDRAIRMVQAMLGHSGISTTEVYLKLSLDRKSRNDLLAGKRMFPQVGGGTVTSLKEEADGEANAGSVRV